MSSPGDGDGVKYALLIGTDHYDDPGFRPLQRAAADVEALARVLEDPRIGGFQEVRTLIDASMAEIREAIAELFFGKTKKDLLLLYFACHADKDDHNRLYLVGRDTQKRLLRGTSIPATFITEEMNNCISRRQVLILDCCYGGAFTEGVRAGQSVPVGTAATFRGNGFARAVLTASDSFEFAHEAGIAGDNSVFTHFLVQGLETGEADLDGDGKISISELYDFIYQRVMTQDARQTPGIWTYKLQGKLFLADRVGGALPRRLQAVRQDKMQVRWTSGSPFRGLEVFDFEHAPIFYGRSEAVRKILEKLAAQAAAHRAFVLVSGISGGGKSSVVRAGVLPDLTAPGTIEGIEIWRRAVARPSDVGEDIFLSLAYALLGPEALPELGSDGPEAPELARAMRESPRAALGSIRGAIAQITDEAGARLEARLVLAVDQLEEIFTMEGVSREDRERFVAFLDVLARSGLVWVIATLRSDFYARASELDVLMALKSENGHYDLCPPTAEEIGQIIRMPARAAGLEFEEDAETGQSLSDVLRDAAVRNRRALPLLEFALEELYHGRRGDGVLTFKAYENLGKVEGALSKRADEVFQTLESKIRESLPRTFRSLVRLGEQDRASRRYAKLESFVAGSPSRALVDAFIEARLFVTETTKDDDVVVSVAHEALLQHWDLLRDWLEKDRDLLRKRLRIGSEAAVWEEQGRSGDFLLQRGRPVFEAVELLEGYGDELAESERSFVRLSIRKSRRFQRFVLAVAAVMAVLAMTASIMAYRATEESRRAMRRADMNDEIVAVLGDLFVNADPEQARGRDLTVREVLDKNVGTVKNGLKQQPAVRSKLLTIIGSTYNHLGIYGPAKELLDEAVAFHKDPSSPRDLIEVGETFRAAADVAFKQSDFKSAETLVREALTAREEVLGREHPDVAETLGALGKFLHAQGRYDEAKKTYHEALRIYERIGDGKNFEWGKYVANLGYLMMTRGDFVGAEEVIERSIQLFEKNFSDNQPWQAKSWRYLGEAYFHQQRYDDAKETFDKALVIQRLVYGEAPHSDVAVTIGNLAAVARRQGRYEDALGSYQEIVDIFTRLHDDPLHPNVAKYKNNCAAVLIDLERYEEANVLLEEAMVIWDMADDYEPQVVAGTKLTAAIALMGMKEFSRAELMARAALMALQDSLEPKHYKIAHAQIVLADSLARQGSCDQAKGLVAVSMESLTASGRSESKEYDDAIKVRDFIAEKCVAI